ncbi:MAG TPA: AMP-binding protein [Spirochaetia bacterium]
MDNLDRLTLQETLLRSAREHADRPALAMVGGQALSYGQLLERARATAARLQASGVRPGDRVALLSENRPEWGVAYFAVVSMGAVVVPIMTDFPAEQVANIVAHAECVAAVVSERLSAKIPAGGRAVVAIESLLTLPGSELQFPEIAEDDLAAIIYTSGTTGQPKGVELTHRNIVFDAGAIQSIMPVLPSDRVLSVLPLAHTYECTIGLISVLMRGAEIFYLDRPPSANALIPALQAVKPTIMLVVPLIMEKIYRLKVLPELEKIPLYRVPVLRRLLVLVAGMRLRRTFGGRMRVLGIGGAALAPDVESFLADARFPYTIGYGLTETSPLVAGSAPFATRLRSTGPAIQGVEVRIAPAPRGEHGEIQVRGPNVMRGYHRDPERTAEVFTKDGWFRTGDLGEIDRKGRLYIRGRLKTMILGASGENIYPEEIEAVINQSPYVDESLVYGDSVGVSALVLLKPDALTLFMSAVREGVASAQQTMAGLLEWIRGDSNRKLAGFSQVRRFHLQSEPFEKTPSQKIKRFLYPRKDPDQHGR